MPDGLMAIKLERTVLDRLEALARAADRPVDELAAAVIADFVVAEETRLSAIREGVAAADAGDLIDHAAVRDWVKSWSGDGELPPPKASRGR